MLGLLIHYEAVINVTEMRIRAAALQEGVKVPFSPPGTACVPCAPGKQPESPLSLLPLVFTLSLLLLSKCITEPLYYVSFPGRQSLDMQEESYDNVNVQTLN